MNPELLTELALAAGLAWGSGLRLYAVVFVFGLLGRLDYVSLPGDLAVIEHDWVLWTSGVMLVGEFIADKVPVFDSAWDALQTFIRLPGGAALAYWALGDHGQGAQVAAALMGGTIVTGTHLTKAAARATLNHSPEPFSNWFASFAEDLLVLAGLWLMHEHPLVFLTLLALFLALVAWLLPKLWRGLKWAFRRLRGGASESPPSVPAPRRTA